MPEVVLIYPCILCRVKPALHKFEICSTLAYGELGEKAFPPPLRLGLKAIAVHMTLRHTVGSRVYKERVSYVSCCIVDCPDVAVAELILRVRDVHVISGHVPPPDPHMSRECMQPPTCRPNCALCHAASIMRAANQTTKMNRHRSEITCLRGGI